ncbi:MAG: hypothetical protein ACYCT2_04680 [Thermoplasmataceae archaeon]
MGRMKIQRSIRDLYEEQSEQCQLLREKVDTLIKSKILEGWHYESRIKSMESFAIKIESGRFDHPDALEDFFGCLVVVRNASEVEAAERMIKDLFNVKYRRPSDPRNPKKKPEDFRYDGIRLYTSLKDEPSLPPSVLNKITFEIQVKTFLMHAWDISMHDIVYKPDFPSWGVSRVAFQVRAMLEHADISIMEVKHLADNSCLNVSTEEFDLITDVIRFLRQKWTDDSLPGDLRHLAENIVSLLNLFQIGLDRLEKIIDLEDSAGRGTELKNLSPYGVIIKSIMNQDPGLISKVLANTHPGNKLLITPELDFVGSRAGRAIFLQ